jgi:hypothetical protein
MARGWEAQNTKLLLLPDTSGGKKRPQEPGVTPASVHVCERCAGPAACPEGAARGRVWRACALC